MANLQTILSRLRPHSDPPRRVATNDLVDGLSRLAGVDQILSFLDSALRETFLASSAAFSLLEPITGRFVERNATLTGARPLHPLDFSPLGDEK